MPPTSAGRSTCITGGWRNKSRCLTWPAPSVPVGPSVCPVRWRAIFNVQGTDAVIEHVKKVWGSAFTTRAIAFRLNNKMPVSWAPIGIAVIMMIEAKSAGVILTVLPNMGTWTGQSSRAISGWARAWSAGR